MHKLFFELRNYKSSIGYTEVMGERQTILGFDCAESEYESWCTAFYIAMQHIKSILMSDE